MAEEMTDCYDNQSVKSEESSSGVSDIEDIEDDTEKCGLNAKQRHEFIDGRLVFNYENLKTIPDVVYTYEGITDLQLNYNNMYSIPEEFCPKLSQLKVLSLMGNRLTALPNNINQLSALEQLYIDENCLAKLPQDLCQLSRLQCLHIQGNRLKALPEEFNGLLQLKDLKLNENKLNELPKKFGLLVNLEELDVSYNSIQVLPETFGSLQSLRVLNVRHNCLTKLSDNFGDLEKVEILELSSNRLNYLPETFRSAKVIQKLYLDSNDLILLPEWFGDMEQIEEICLKSNSLRGIQFPERFGTVCQKLTKFDISGNLMEGLPESFAQLKNLLLVDTGSTLYEPERRKDLRNGNNIQKLPQNFGFDYKFMKELRLDENDIEVLPDCFGEGMPSLEILDLYCNAITVLPDSVCKLKSLSVFSIGMNCLKKLPENFGHLTALEEFRAEINQLKFLPKTFDKLVNLRVLDLYNNHFDVFPSILKNLENLKNLQIGLQVSQMAIRIDSREQFKIDRLNWALSRPVPKCQKRTNFFADYRNYKNTHLTEDSQDWSQFNGNSNHSSMQSSGYESNTSDEKLAAVEDMDIPVDSWECDIFDPNNPYLNEPITHPNNHQIQIPFESFKFFIPYKTHPKRIQVKRQKLMSVETVEGQFDDNP